MIELDVSHMERVRAETDKLLKRFSPAPGLMGGDRFFQEIAEEIVTLRERLDGQVHQSTDGEEI